MRCTVECRASGAADTSQRGRIEEGSWLNTVHTPSSIKVRGSGWAWHIVRTIDRQGSQIICSCCGICDIRRRYGSLNASFGLSVKNLALRTSSTDQSFHIENRSGVGTVDAGSSIIEGIAQWTVGDVIILSGSGYVLINDVVEGLVAGNPVRSINIRLIDSGRQNGCSGAVLLKHCLDGIQIINLVIRASLQLKNSRILGQCLKFIEQSLDVLYCGLTFVNERGFIGFSDILALIFQYQFGDESCRGQEYLVFLVENALFEDGNFVCNISSAISSTDSLIHILVQCGNLCLKFGLLAQQALEVICSVIIGQMLATKVQSSGRQQQSAENCDKLYLIHSMSIFIYENKIQMYLFNSIFSSYIIIIIYSLNLTNYIYF